MKKYALLTLVIVCHSIVFGQKKCYEDSLDLEGYIVSDCGRKKSVISFDDKLMIEPGSSTILWRNNMQPFNGECESCNPINEKTSFRLTKVENGNINGAYYVNHPSGCIQERGSKVMGKFDGKIELFYDTTNAVKEISNYVLGKLEGAQLFLKPNGDTISFENYKIISKGEKIESILHGIQRSYYSNGKLELEVNYNLGELDGDYKKYSEEGILINDRKFKKGKEFGKCISYYDNGKVMLIENWKDGVKDGEFVYYLPNDSIKFKEFYKKGLPEGTFIEYHNNRQMQSKVVYVKGEKISEKYWNEYGQDITEERKKELESLKQNDSISPKKQPKSKHKDSNSQEEKKSKKEKGKKESKKKKGKNQPAKEEEEEEL